MTVQTRAIPRESVFQPFDSVAAASKRPGVQWRASHRRAFDPRPLPTFFLAGCQKCASSWIWRCLREHPDVFVPTTDAVHFFTIKYHRGFEWYEPFFGGYAGEPQVGDTTPQYWRNARARERMAAFNPHAKLILSVRNPIERAFSHYWHEKRKRKTNRPFADALNNNIDVFESWIGSGFYMPHIRELLTLFPREQLLVVLYDDLQKNPRSFLRQIFEFLEVNPGFTPSVLNAPVNRATYRPGISECITNLLHGRRLFESEYDRGIDPRLRGELREIFRPYNDALAEFLGRDLSCWK